jgi:protein involved in polysaccharide export with SLBB domain
VLPKLPYKIGIFDFLRVRAIGTLLEQPIDNYFWVEPTGTVALGPVYGRVEVKGMTLDEAQAAIETKLKQILIQPTVQVTLFRQKDQRELWRRTTPPQSPYTIKPGVLLSIDALGTLLDQPIEGTFAVEALGTVALGPGYGRVRVEGLSLQAAEKAIQKKLEEIVRKPEVQVTFAGWQREENDPLMAAVVARRTAQQQQRYEEGQRILRSLPHVPDNENHK